MPPNISQSTIVATQHKLRSMVSPSEVKKCHHSLQVPKAIHQHVSYSPFDASQILSMKICGCQDDHKTHKYYITHKSMYMWY